MLAYGGLICVLLKIIKKDFFGLFSSLFYLYVQNAKSSYGHGNIYLSNQASILCHLSQGLIYLWPNWVHLFLISNVLIGVMTACGLTPTHPSLRWRVNMHHVLINFSKEPCCCFGIQSTQKYQNLQIHTLMGIRPCTYTGCIFVAVCVHLIKAEEAAVCYWQSLITLY